ncbi:MAG: hypothetical protein PHQ36_03645 [Anaerolineales bacterium]|nr:hypothetical protein [Anaerolineales bacterium]
MKNLPRNFFLPLFALLVGFGIGLAYSWVISPVEYVDASPALLRDDFKDQYRIVVAASYASAHDLARARARLELLGDADLIGALSAQAQRMVGVNESDSNKRALALLATDLQKGVVSIPATRVSLAPTAQPTAATLSPTESLVIQTSTPTAETIQTPFAMLAFTLTPRPTFTSTVSVGAPFALIGQDTVCDPGVEAGLLQFTLLDSRRRQIAGVEIIVTSIAGEDHLFTGFKPEVGNGYADFVMQENISYSIRIVEGGTFINNISAPSCADPNGKKYLGGLSLTFQQ